MTSLLLCLLPLLPLARLAQEDLVPPESASRTAAEPGEVFVNANAAYEAGEFGKAAARYQSLVDRGIENGYLYYNLGNAYLRAGELGRAIAAYRRCQTLLPRYRDVVANLEFARRSARDAIEPPAPSAVARTLFFWHFGLSRTELQRATVLLEILFFSVLALYVLRRRSELLRWSAILVLVLLVASGSSLLVRTLSPLAVAVIVPQEVNVHSGVDTESVVRFKLHAGTEVEVVEERADWLRIELPGGEQGWVERRHTEMIEGV